MSNKTGPCRALIAYGLRGSAIILATDNADLARETDAVSDGAEDCGLTADGNERAGLYLFEGEGTWRVHVGFEGDKDVELEWEGTERPVLPHELPALLALAPPDEELLAWGADYREESP